MTRLYYAEVELYSVILFETFATRLYYTGAELYSSILFGTGSGLEIPELGHQEQRLENQAQPRVPLQVVDIHARRYSVI